MLTVRDVSLILGVSEKEVMDLAETGKIPAYKVGGVYLRFKREQIEEFKKTLKTPGRLSQAQDSSVAPFRIKATFKDKVSDFFYFNDFYILSILIILLMLMLILRG